MSPITLRIIEDIDADGRVEIIVHGVTFGMGFIVLDGMTGKEKWRKELNGYGVTLANLDSDPQEELLVYDPMLYCIDGRTGDLQWTFAGKPTTLEPLLADLDGDGSREIVAMWEGAISILSPEGKLKGLVSFPSRIPRPFGFTSGDLDGDGADELLVSLGNEILVLKGEEVERTYRVTLRKSHNLPLPDRLGWRWFEGNRRYIPSGALDPRRGICSLGVRYRGESGMAPEFGTRSYFLTLFFRPRRRW